MKITDEEVGSAILIMETRLWAAMHCEINSDMLTLTGVFLDITNMVEEAEIKL